MTSILHEAGINSQQIKPAVGCGVVTSVAGVAPNVSLTVAELLSSAGGPEKSLTHSQQPAVAAAANIDPSLTPNAQEAIDLAALQREILITSVEETLHKH